jgi:hypothetical protein
VAINVVHTPKIVITNAPIATNQGKKVATMNKLEEADRK